MPSRKIAPTAAIIPSSSTRQGQAARVEAIHRRGGQTAKPPAFVNVDNKALMTAISMRSRTASTSAASAKNTVIGKIVLAGMLQSTSVGTVNTSAITRAPGPISWAWPLRRISCSTSAMIPAIDASAAKMSASPRPPSASVSSAVSSHIVIGRCSLCAAMKYWNRSPRFFNAV